MGFSPSVPPYPYIAVNDDDDDANGIMDNRGGSLPSDDDDLVPLNLSVNSPRGSLDDVRLGLIHATNALQVWGGRKRTGLLINNVDLSEQWGADMGSKTVYVEGMLASAGTADGDPTLTYYYYGRHTDPLNGWNGDASKSQKRWTVVHVDMDMDGVADDQTGGGDPHTQEITPGGFIPLGSSTRLVVRPVMPALTIPSWPDVTLSVEYSGSGQIEVWDATHKIDLPHPFSPTSDTTFWVKGTHESIDPCDVKLILTHGITSFKDRINLTIVKIQVDGVGFINDHVITKWPGGPDIDPNNDSNTPIWATGINYPVCYTKNTAVSMFASFTVEPNIGTTITGVRVRARDVNTVVASATGCIIAGARIQDTLNNDGDVDGIAGGSPVPDSNGVKTLTPSFTWEVSLDGIAWYPAGTSGPHTMYWTDSTPAASPLYDLGLQKACGYVAGDSNIGGKINSGLAGDLYYDPCQETAHDLHIFDPGVNRGQCCCHAAVFGLLVSHVTNSTPPSLFLWGGCSSTTRCHYIYRTWICGPTFQCNSPANDGAPANPHFTFHVEATYNGTNYDPSYGTTGLTTFTEMAPAHTPHPAATQQQGSGLPSAAHAVQWTCPH